MVKINIDDLVCALSDTKVTDALSKAFERKLSSIESTLATLVNDLRVRDERIEQLEIENATLRAELQHQTERIDDLESYTRRDNLIIHGLPETYATALRPTDGASSAADALNSAPDLGEESMFIKFCHDKLRVPITPQDISICHRLKKNANNDKVRPLIVRFVSRKARSAVLGARKTLRDQRAHVYINEHLSPAANKLFAEARKLAKNKVISGAWSWNGQIYVKLLNSQIKLVTNFAELNRITAAGTNS